MADSTLTPDELAALLDGAPVALTPEATDPELLAALFPEGEAAAPEAVENAGTPQTQGRPSEGQLEREGAPAVAAPPASGSAAVEPAWLQALEQAPEYERVMRHYPSLAATRLDKTDVIAVLYLHDHRRGVVRNYTIDGESFLDTPALKTVELGGKGFAYRVVVKFVKRRAGMTIKCWEHHPGGDAPGTRLKVVVGERRLTTTRLG